jgi:hypothetical protein
MSVSRANSIESPSFSRKNSLEKAVLALQAMGEYEDAEQMKKERMSFQRKDSVDKAVLALEALGEYEEAEKIKNNKSRSQQKKGSKMALGMGLLGMTAGINMTNPVSKGPSQVDTFKPSFMPKNTNTNTNTRTFYNPAANPLRGNQSSIYQNNTFPERKSIFTDEVWK